MVSSRPIRVLHVIGSMNRGGAETELLHVLRWIDRGQFQSDLVVHTNKAGAYDDQVRALGSDLIPCLHPSHPFAYGRNLKRILREEGPYDVIHSHVHHYSGYVLRLAFEAGVPIRIAHSHSESVLTNNNPRLIRRLYLALMKQWINQYATLGLAVSQKAARALFGMNWAVNPRRQVFRNSIDPTPFQTPVDRRLMREKLGISNDAVVLGHMGRFALEKNHPFLIEVFAEFVRQEPNAQLVLVGDGPLRSKIQSLSEVKGVSDKVHLLGTRSDIPEILGAMDLLLFPSLSEGLPMTLIEAQAAGVPGVVSDAVSNEVDFQIGLVQFVSLGAGVEVWIEKIRKGLTIPRPDVAERLNALKARGFDIRQQVTVLQEIYVNGQS